jgi:hypothetical protein
VLRPLVLSLLSILAFASAFAGCNADLEEGCISGPCGTPGPARPAEPGTGGGGGAGGGPDCSGTPDTGDFPCEVYAVLKAKCHTCHTDPPTGNAPFPLLTYELTRAPFGSKQRWEQMRADIASGYMPFGTVAPDLTPEEQQVLLDWFATCALPEPEGQGCDCDDPAACP